jgi:hypothetical protein
MSRLVVPSFKRNHIDPMARNNQIKNIRNPYDNKVPSAVGPRGAEAPFSDNVIQAEIFNNEIEVQDITVHGYLNKFCHDIITFKMCEKLIDLWKS